MGPTQRKLLRETISSLASQTLCHGCFSSLLLLQAQSALRPSERHCSLMLEEAICLATIGSTHRLTERTHKSGLTWDLFFFLNFARTLLFFPATWISHFILNGRQIRDEKRSAWMMQGNQNCWEERGSRRQPLSLLPRFSSS